MNADCQERIYRLWDDLAAFGATQVDEALNFLLTNVAEMVDAQNAYWFVAIRLAEAESDPLLGWRPRSIKYLQLLPDDASFTKDRIKSIERGAIDESVVAQARQAGAYRSNRMRDLVSPEWFDGPIYQGYVGRGVHDSLVVGVPVSPNIEAYYGFLRMRPDDPFTEQQREIALRAMRGLTWFHRQVLLAHGLLVASSPLSPMERRVLSQLLTDLPEKSIATELGISSSSLHTYVRDILRKFGVSGRKGLTALWLGKQS